MSEYSEQVEQILLAHFNKWYTNNKEYPWNPNGPTREEQLELFTHSREGFLAGQLLKPLGKQLIHDNTDNNDVWMIVPIEEGEDEE